MNKKPLTNEIKKFFILDKSNRDIYKACKFLAIKFNFNLIDFNEYMMKSEGRQMKSITNIVEKENKYIKEITSTNSCDIIIIDESTFVTTNIRTDETVHVITIENFEENVSEENLITYLYDVMRPLIINK